MAIDFSMPVLVPTMAGAHGAALMQALTNLVEHPLLLAA